VASQQELAEAPAFPSQTSTKVAEWTPVDLRPVPALRSPIRAGMQQDWLLAPGSQWGRWSRWDIAPGMP